MIDILPVLAHVILEDNSINSLVDGQVAPGDPSTNEDAMLAYPNKTCIIVSELMSESHHEMGNEETASDAQVDISIISKNSKAYCRQVSNLVKDFLLDDINITWDGASIYLLDFGVMRHSLYDPALSQWRDVLTVSFKFWE
ncbi:MAG: hypothetical protein WC124_02030 [Desulfoplanes sp.]